MGGTKKKEKGQKRKKDMKYGRMGGRRYGR
jgi:hypothetical protein